MKTKIISTLLLVLLTTIGFSQNLTVDELKTTNGVLKIQPITHGSLKQNNLCRSLWRL